MSSKLEQARAATARLRQRVRAGNMTSGASAFGAGVLQGFAEQRGIVPVAFGGMLPTKPVLATIAWYLASRSSVGSTAHNVLQGAGDGLAGAYGYESVQKGSLIAGEGAYAEEESVDLMGPASGNLADDDDDDDDDD